MTRFNKQAINQHLKFDTTNHEGEKAHSINPELELYSLVCTCALQNQFYRSESETLERLKELIMIVAPGYTKKLAVYAREKMYLRSIPFVIAVLLAKNGHCSKKFVERIIQRADEITELLAIWSCLYGGDGIDRKVVAKLPASIKKGIALAFKKFDTYQFAKYKRDDKEITLRDAMFLCHPKPENKEREQLYKMIAEKSLPAPYTWEVGLSTAREKGKTKREIWEELIYTNAIGYMALLRNIRNVLEANVRFDILELMRNNLQDKKAVLRSKQLPFRFLSAYREIEDVQHPDIHLFLDALEAAIMHSCNNIPGFDGQTLLIASDVSGSMTYNPISQKSKIYPYDIGLILSMMLQSKTRCYTGIFGQDFRIKQLPKDRIIENAMRLDDLGNEVGHSTNGYLAVKWLNDTKTIVDKVMMFTDCQLWDSRGNNSLAHEWIKYKSFNPGAKFYLFDLVGYGSVPLTINEHDVHLIAGWSDKIFDVLAALDKGKNAIDVINGVEL